MFSSSLHPQKIIDVLKRIPDPVSQRSLIEAGLIEGVTLEKGQVTISLRISPDKKDLYEPLRVKITHEVSCLKEVKKVFTLMTAHTGKPSESPSLTIPSSSKINLPSIGSVIAVASGKGGVGKSLVAVNLALALKKQGQRVGIVDLDIYGPSLPKMINLYAKPETNEQKKFIPLKKYGLQCISMGFFVSETAPIIWRGPMIQTAVVQLIRDVIWDNLDILVIDLPPGTGDTHLTLIQKIALQGAIIVSTPQDLALMDARKALLMFQKMNIPILGIIENMSYFSCPACGAQTDIFNHGGARQEAQKLALPFLGEIPLAIDLRMASDQGVPLLESDPPHLLSQNFFTIAKNILHELEKTL